MEQLPLSVRFQMQEKLCFCSVFCPPVYVNKLQRYFLHTQELYVIINYVPLMEHTTDQKLSRPYFLFYSQLHVTLYKAQLVGISIYASLYTIQDRKNYPGTQKPTKPYEKCMSLITRFHIYMFL